MVPIFSGHWPLGEQHLWLVQLPVGRRTNDSPSFEEIDILWITAGLGCDGDTIAVTAATQPTLEEVLMGALLGIPKVNFHNPFLSYANGEDFLRPFHLAAENQQASFILVVEGSIPNENAGDIHQRAVNQSDLRTFRRRVKKKMLTIAFAGKDGGRIREVAEYCFTVPSIQHSPHSRMPCLLAPYYLGSDSCRHELG